MDNELERAVAGYPATSVDLLAGLSDSERAELVELRDAVYPPAADAEWSGADMEWAAARWRVGIWAAEDELVCHAGLLVRTGRFDDAEVTIAGVGGVKTHPDHRGRGYGALAMRAAQEFFRSRGDIDFALLVCDPPLLGYYAALGWQEFEGRLSVTQFGKRSKFDFSRVMVLPIGGPAPVGGMLDLAGPPW
ncbi:GNAT family N-acetyltransferase [Actinoalloteichus hymeniacidonis]|uniref:Acetyltransferase (GNAT) domain n=1 Tax=Actinoalloteichus hymeniacidonis TaxID=340345 RepID=A0AAC9HS31_9PSEU|nr:GNAT family N-acetyltransferase [Actinoalloteichus hymeniacidonis]AOS64549.1 Acetyltransferase (GNAT) domain [Actinoalloteichus hymeniacidonis]MBB5907379.1 GNAT superfamily N-acetyltransferase [Actinoalloteichus hymeniacidonis]